MKRVLSLIVSLILICMPLSVLFSVSADEPASVVGQVDENYAPDGRPVASESDFLAMTANGRYYLSADITLTNSYPAKFSGTLDGAGHTVTISKAMFFEFAGTVKNLTIEGTVNKMSMSGHTGTIANEVTGNAEVVNVLNKADVSGYNSEIKGTAGTTLYSGTGGFFGRASGKGNVLLIDGCENLGNINGYAAGGFLGLAENSSFALKIKNSRNYGTVSDYEAVKVSNNSAVGGFVGATLEVADIELENLSNFGFVVGSCGNRKDVVTLAGGIVGFIQNSSVLRNKAGSSEPATLTVMKNISNFETVHATNHAGGICGWIMTSLEADGLYNRAKIESDGNYAGGMFARFGSDAECTASGKLDGPKAVINNAVNEGAVISEKGQTGGIVSYSVSEIEFYDCINRSDIFQSIGNAGGILGYGNTGCIAKFYRCENDGNIYAGDYAGGIVGRILGTSVSGNAASKGGYMADAFCCVNTGNIESFYSAGGIVGTSGTSGRYGLVSVRCSVNSGDIVSHGGTGNSNGGAGGMIGYTYGSGTNEFPSVENCVTVGNIICYGDTFGEACYFMGYFNSANAVVKNNFAAGTITAARKVSGTKTGKAEFAFCWDNASELKAENVTGNTVPDGYTLTWENSKLTKTYETGKYDENYVSSGHACYDLNIAAGGTVFFQTIGEDAIPTLDASRRIVISDGNDFKNREEKPKETEPVETEPEDTTVPEDTTEAVPDTTTEPAPEETSGENAGCASFALWQVAAVFATAPITFIIRRKRK